MLLKYIVSICGRRGPLDKDEKRPARVLASDHLPEGEDSSHIICPQHLIGPIISQILSSQYKIYDQCFKYMV